MRRRPAKARPRRRDGPPEDAAARDRGTDDDLREFADRMSEAEQILGFGTWRWELASGRVRWSHELHRIYGLAPGEFDGTVEAFLSYLHPGDRDRVWALIEHALDTGEAFGFEERIVRADGEERVLLSQGRVVMGPAGAAQALIGVCHDVTDRAAAESALGLSERRMRAIIDNSPSLIGVKDLAGRYLMTNAETGRILGRPAEELVGQRCVELFPEISEQLLANDHLAAAELKPVYDEAVLRSDGESRTYATVTFALPDKAGRAVETCTIATDVTERREHDSRRRERVGWENRIAAALAGGGMLAFAQPVIDLAGGAAEWCELLVRMRSGDHDGDLLDPAAFLPAAERFGLVQAIDVWVVRQALAMGPGPAPEVNLSAVTLCDAAARSEILALLRSDPAAASRIVFEITETAAAEHLDAACGFATALTDLGCGVALDDFGTGFGSFTYLRRLPLRYLKIDRSFVVDLVRSRDDQRVVESIIQIARQFGLRTIAEGVEDEATLQLLRALGADFAQGFHLGRPAPLAVPVGS
jgi:PAS domain S-box-containing protein